MPIIFAFQKFFQFSLPLDIFGNLTLTAVMYFRRLETSRTSMHGTKIEFVKKKSFLFESGALQSLAQLLEQLLVYYRG